MMPSRFFSSLLLVFLYLILIKPTHAIAIECEKASKKDEKIICASPSLKNYDSAMTRIYTAVLDSLNNDQKNKFITQQKDWLAQRALQRDESKILDLYAERLREICKSNNNICKSISEDLIKKWLEKSAKNMNDVDSIIIASYFKGNITDYVTDKKVLRDIEDEINANDHMSSLDIVEVNKLNGDHVLLTVLLYMGAYQGESISFLYDQKGFSVIRFPVYYEGKLNYSYTHSNYADWVNSLLMIHNRSQGYLYECGTTQYYQYVNNEFKLIKQESIPCSEKELEDIQSGKLQPENIKVLVDYPVKSSDPASDPMKNDPVKNSSDNKTQDNTSEKRVPYTGNDTSNFLTQNSNLQFTFLFPVVGEEVKLKVTIPKGFKSLESGPNAELLEFIPKTDKDPYQWSQIITLTKILGSGISAREYIEKLKDLFINSVDRNTKVIEERVHDHTEGYQDALSILQYHAKERDEVVILYSVSGPLDIANVQYALPLSSTEKSDLEVVVQKLKEFIKNNLEIVNNNESML